MSKPIRKTDSPVLFIQKAIENALSEVYTSVPATITSVGDSTVNVIIDTSGVELDDVPVFTLQGGSNYLQFPISAGDQCMLVFSRDSVDNWQGGGSDLVYSTNFDLNNGFALVGINNDTSAINIPTSYTDLTVKKIKIQNETAELITTLSDVTSQLIDTIKAIQALTVTVSGVTSSVPVNVADFVLINTSLETLKTELDSFKA